MFSLLQPNAKVKCFIWLGVYFVQRMQMNDFGQIV